MRTSFIRLVRTILLLITSAMLAPIVSLAQDQAVRLSPEELAAKIDGLFEKSWSDSEIIPADRASDAEYLRRVYLDLAGRIPAASEAREFLADAEPGKRVALVNRLLDSPSSVRNMTTVWRNSLIPQAASQPEFRGLIPGFEAWLWKHISENTPYDVIVREIITTPVGEANTTGGVLSSASSPEAFYVVRELKPENLATGTSRAFLGVRLDCAQCHDHPFDRWKQHQFWSMAAFYSGFAQPVEGSAPVMAMNVAEKKFAREIQIPSTGQVVPAIFLSGQTPAWSDQESTRDVLARWVTSPDNPWFAKMAANRVWGQFMGQAMVQPMDDFSDANPPSHPEVLDLLAQQFVLHNFDLQYLVRAVTATGVYQRSSLQTHDSQSDPSMFARAALRGLSPEQFFDSLAEAIGFYQPFRSGNPFVLDDDSPRSRFLELYRSEAESPLQRETTILQALAMMNGEFVASATSIENSQTLRAVVEFPLMNDDERLDTLFLATLTRLPTDAERTQFSSYLQEGGAAGDRGSAFTDIFWVLLNSSEFLLNH